ncbi:MAG: single-stranded DNA-binding protein [Sulfurospirillum sp.]|nr:single-stranded DNA-binding protein [Sulfurospirillum sp.]
MFNKVILVGNLTRDCELRYAPSGSAVCSTAIATNRKYKNQMGEQKEEVCFVDITFFGRTAEIANQYLGRGKKVLIEGRLKLDQWTDQSGAKRSKHSVQVESLQMLDGKNDGNTSAPSNGGYQNPTSKPQTPTYTNKHDGNDIPDIDIDADEIPF